MEAYIQMKNVSKDIKKQPVLENIQLSLEKNQVYGIYGANGSGKTMLLRALAGLIKVDGTINIGTVKNIGVNHFPESVGILIENPSFFQDFTGLENLRLLSTFTERVREEELTEKLIMVGLDPADKRKYKKYSLGMKQRLGVAQALVGNPELVLLDEPTNALDPDAVVLVETIIQSRKDNTTFVITSHDKAFLKAVSTKTFRMEQGRLTEEILI